MVLPRELGDEADLAALLVRGTDEGVEDVTVARHGNSEWVTWGVRLGYVAGGAAWGALGRGTGKSC